MCHTVILYQADSFATTLDNHQKWIGGIHMAGAPTFIFTVLVSILALTRTTLREHMGEQETMTEIILGNSPGLMARERGPLLFEIMILQGKEHP